MGLDINKAVYGRKYVLSNIHQNQLLGASDMFITDNLCESKSDYGKYQSAVDSNFNPYDFVGIFHNEALDHYFETFGADYRRSSSLIGCMTMVNSYLSTKFGFGLRTDDANKKLGLVLGILTKTTSGSIPALPVEGRAQLSLKNAQLLNQLVIDVSSVSTREQSDSVIAEILKMETQLMNEPIPLNESALVFSSLSVARHALQYRIESPNVSFPTVSSSTAARGWPSWAGSDIMGAYTAYQVSLAGIGGAVGGGPIGFFGTMAAVGAAGSYISTLH